LTDTTTISDECAEALRDLTALLEDIESASIDEDSRKELWRIAGNLRAAICAPATRVETDRASRAIHALRKPDSSLSRVPNTIRQSIAEVIEETVRQVDKYGIALMMISEGCSSPQELAGDALAGFGGQSRQGRA
jgi:hypothetical protein